jgi:hypothetical protein
MTTAIPNLTPHHYPVYILLESSLLPSSSDFLSYLTQTHANSNITVLTREEFIGQKPKNKKTVSDANSAGVIKKKNLKDYTEEEKREAERYSIDDNFVDVLKERVEAELLARNQLIADRRARELAEIDPTISLSSSKPSKLKPNKPSAAAPNKGQTSRAGSAKKGPEETPESHPTQINLSSTEESARYLEKQRLISSWPTQLAQIFLLIDIVDRAADLEKLSTQGIVPNAAAFFLSQAHLTAPETKNSAHALEQAEFHYHPSDIKGNSAEKGENSTESRKNQGNQGRRKVKIHPFDLNLYNSSQNPQRLNESHNSGAVFPSELLESLRNHAESHEILRDFVFLAVVPPISTAPPQFGAEIAKENPEKGSKALKSPRSGANNSGSSEKSAKKAPSSAKKSISELESAVKPLVSAFLLQINEFSGQFSDFSAWKREKTVVSLPTPAENSIKPPAVALKLYNSILDSFPQSLIGVDNIISALFKQISHDFAAENTENSVKLVETALEQQKLADLQREVEEKLNFATGKSQETAQKGPGGPKLAHFWAEKHCLNCGMSELIWRQEQNLANQEDSANFYCSAAFSSSKRAILGQNGPKPVEIVAFGDIFSLKLALSNANQASKQLIWADFRLKLKNSLLPGVQRCGMPSFSSQKLTLSARNEQITALFNAAQNNLSVFVLERGILLLELRDMIEKPGEKWEFSVISAQNAEKGYDCSAFHVEHEISPDFGAEEALLQRELEQIAPESARRHRQRLNLANFPVEGRCIIEEFDENTLAQRLEKALYSAGNTKHCSVRYNSLQDELIIVISEPIPINRQEISTFWAYLTPDLTLQQFLAANPAVISHKTGQIHRFSSPNHTGKLAIQSKTLFPVNLATLGARIAQNGEEISVILWIQAGETLISIQETSETVKIPQNKEEGKEISEGPSFSDFAREIADLEQNSSGNGTKRGEKGGKKLSKREREAEERELAEKTAKLVELQRKQADFEAESARKAQESAYRTVIQRYSALSAVFYDETRLSLAQHKLSYISLSGLALELALHTHEITQIPPESTLKLAFPVEIRRTINKQGQVTRVFSDNSVEILHFDGSTARKAANSTVFTIIDCRGVIIAAENSEISVEKTLSCVEQRDSLSNSTIFTRSDGGITIFYGSTGILAQHSDGTRIYTDFSAGKPAKFTVEKLNFVPIELNLEENSVSCQFADGSTLKTFVDHGNHCGAAVFSKENGEKLLISAAHNGIYYVPSDFSSNSAEFNEIDPIVENCPQNVFFIENSAENSFITVRDIENNKFSAFSNGETAVSLSAPLETNENHEKNGEIYYSALPVLQPRVFVARGEGGGYELLDSTAVSSWEQRVQREKSQFSALPVEKNGQNSGNCYKWVQKVRKQDYYVRKAVIPAVIKQRNNSLLHDFSAYRSNSLANPSAAAYFLRKFLEFSPISPENLQFIAQLRANHAENTVKHRNLELEQKFIDFSAILGQEHKNSVEMSEKLAKIKEILQNQQKTAEINRNQQELGALNLLQSQEEQKQPNLADFTGNFPSSIVNLPRSPANSTENSAKLAYLQGIVAKKPRNFFQTGKKVRESADKPQEIEKITEKLADLKLSSPNNVENWLKRRVLGFYSAVLSHSQPSAQLSALFPALSLLDQRLSARFSPNSHQISLEIPEFQRILLESALFTGLLGILGWEKQGASYFLGVSEREAAQRSQIVRELAGELLGRAENQETSLDREQKTSETGGNNGDFGVKTREFYVESSAEGEREEDLDSLGGEEPNYEEIMAELEKKEQFSGKNLKSKEKALLEAKLRSLPANYTSGHHDPHGKSFKLGRTAGKTQNLLGNSGISAVSLEKRRENHAKSIEFDVSGAPRRDNVVLPAHLLASVAPQPNFAHLTAELTAGQPRPSVRISSTAAKSLNSAVAGFAEFTVQPAAVEFGTVKKGSIYRATVALTNTGSVTGRFTVQQPENGPNQLCTVQLLYRPGLVAPGLQRKIDIQLFAGESGQFQQVLTVKTEQSIFELPISAVIVPESAWTEKKYASSGTKKGSARAQKVFSNPSTFDLPINSAGAHFSKGGNLEGPESARSGRGYAEIGEVRESPRVPGSQQNSDRA